MVRFLRKAKTQILVKRDGEDREVVVPGPPILVGSGLLQKLPMLGFQNYPYVVFVYVVGLKVFNNVTL
jgi:hypothetical protein